VRKLAETRWTGWGKDTIIEDLARSLGVQPDVLLDAHRYLRSLTDRGTVVAGLAPIKMRSNGQRVSVGTKMTINLVMPKEIHAEWLIYRKLGMFTDSVLLRSLIHYGLIRPEQPQWVGRGWPFKGKVYHCLGWSKLKATEVSWPWTVSTRISYGAKTALLRRASSMRITIRAFIRGLVIDLLSGSIQSFDTVTEASQMFEVDRYFTLDGMLEDKALRQQSEARKRS
jgi:hypothetical protein